MGRVLLSEFDTLEGHRQFAESALRNAANDLEERVHAETESMDPDEADYYHDHMYDEHVQTRDYIPRAQWNSQLLVVFSVFEYTLNGLCRIAERRLQLDRTLTDESGKGIERAKNYLSRVADVKNPFRTTRWQRARLLGEIRNAIAHGNGEIEVDPNNSKLLSTRLMDESHLSLDMLIAHQDDTQIVLTSEFIRDAIEELKGVLEEICNHELPSAES